VCQVEWLGEKSKDIPIRLVFESALELMGTTQLGGFKVRVLNCSRLFNYFLWAATASFPRVRAKRANFSRVYLVLVCALELLVSTQVGS